MLRSLVGSEMCIRDSAWIGGMTALTISALLTIAKALTPGARWMIMHEWRHPFRRYLWNGPHLSVTMLCLGTPESAVSHDARRAAFVVCSIAQVVLACRYYRTWMFDQAAGLSRAGPPFLLSVIGWLLLCVLAQQESLREDWGFDFGLMYFGVGVIFYGLALVGLFLHMHDVEGSTNSPANFLIIAPASVAVACLESFDQNFSGAARAAFGFGIVMLVLLLSTKPPIVEPPSVLGHYWPYVFPVAALGSAAVRYGNSEDSEAAKVVGWVILVLQSIIFVTVLFRESFHFATVFCCGAPGTDPLFSSFPMEGGNDEPEPAEEETVDSEANAMTIDDSATTRTTDLKPDDLATFQVEVSRA
eukprot:TRINITY_DN43136_c0_g1_i2.p1 TRINITY_DN43136_c0_g1~~TRINITY_DN43136_c0_g1_i2.p1  ORF type:complete len:359 (-),score=70.15 TRINITY_DN43136_c0_g1_i2:92-1168(-)